MTVKELKELLEALDDDLEIVIDDNLHNTLPTTGIMIFKNEDGDTEVMLG